MCSMVFSMFKIFGFVLQGLLDEGIIQSDEIYNIPMPMQVIYTKASLHYFILWFMD